MQNFKELLTAQRDALTKDIEEITGLIQISESATKGYKSRKSLAVKELKAIEKKLGKL